MPLVVAVGDVSLDSAGDEALVAVVDVGDMVTGVGVLVLLPLLLLPCDWLTWLLLLLLFLKMKRRRILRLLYLPTYY